MKQVRVPISERIASKLVKENDNNLTAYIVATKTIFKNAQGEEIFEMTKEMRGEQEMVSYAMYMPEYKQGE